MDLFTKNKEKLNNNELLNIYINICVDIYMQWMYLLNYYDKTLL